MKIDDLPHPNNKVSSAALRETLISLASTRQIKTTAKELGVDRTTVRYRIIQLEERVGGAVVTKTGGKFGFLTITPLGWEIIDGAVEDFLTTSEASELSGMEPRRIVSLIERGHITATKEYGLWHLPKAEFLQFLATYDASADKIKAASFTEKHEGHISMKRAIEIIGASSANTITGCIKRGELDGFKDGRFWYINEASARELAKTYSPEEWRKRRGLRAAEEARAARAAAPKKKRKQASDVSSNVTTPDADHATAVRRALQQRNNAAVMARRLQE